MKKRSVKNIILYTISGLALVATPISFLAMFLGKHPYTWFAVYMFSLAWNVVFAYVNKEGVLSV